MSDNFNRPDNASIIPAETASWTIVSGAFSLVSNTAQCTPAGTTSHNHLLGCNNAIDDASIGTTVWDNPSYATFNDGVDYADTAPDVVASHFLDATFNFASVGIPAYATINGVEVQFQVASDPTQADSAQDNSVRLLLGGTPAGSDYANVGTAWPSSPTWVTYGGATDLWGLGLISVADVVDPNFGAAISAQSLTGGTYIAQVYACQITVYWTQTLFNLASATGSVLCSGGGLDCSVAPTLLYAECKVQSDTDGDTLRVGIDGPGPYNTKWFAELTVGSSAKLSIIDTSNPGGSSYTETIAATADVTAAINTQYTLGISWDGAEGAVFFGGGVIPSWSNGLRAVTVFLDGVPIIAQHMVDCESGGSNTIVSSASYTRTGCTGLIGTGQTFTGTADFDDFTLSMTTGDCAACPTYGYCQWPVGTPLPNTITVTVAGLSGGIGVLNGTYHLTVNPSKAPGSTLSVCAQLAGGSFTDSCACYDAAISIAYPADPLAIYIPAGTATLIRFSTQQGGFDNFGGYSAMACAIGYGSPTSPSWIAIFDCSINEDAGTLVHPNNVTNAIGTPSLELKSGYQKIWATTGYATAVTP